MRIRGTGFRLARVLAGALLVAILVGCSPEDDRQFAGGPGADPGNRSYPLPRIHGNQVRNNPSANVPDVGRVPREAKGVPGFWAQPGPPS